MTSNDAMEAARRKVTAGPGDQLLERLAERIGARAGVEAVFGAPVRAADLTVVPVARIRWGVGAGGGASERERASGSGGGGGVAADPVGYLQITPAGAEFRPIGRPYASPAFLLTAAVAGAIVIRAVARLR